MSQYEILHLIDGAQPKRYTVNGQEILIGRSTKADIVIDGQSVSRLHARVSERGGALQVEDLGSRNGIRCNGARVREAPLKPGDRFSVGESNFMIVESGGSSATPLPDPVAPNAPGMSEPAVKRGSSMQIPALSVRPEIVMELYGLVLDREALFQRIARLTIEGTSMERAFVLARTPASAQAKMLASCNRGSNSLGCALNKAIIEHVARTRTGVMRPLDPQNGGAAPTALAPGQIRPGAMCAPLAGKGDCLGVLYLDSGLRPGTLSAGELQWLESFGRVAGVAIETAYKHVLRLEQARRMGTSEAAAEIADGVVRSLPDFAPAVSKVANAGVKAELQSLVDRASRVAANLACLGRRREVTATCLDANTVIEYAIGAVRVQAEQQKVNIAFTRSGRMLINAVQDDLVFSLVNLLTNAIDAASGKGGQVCVHAEVRADGCHLVVHDTGDGLPAAVEARLKRRAQKAVDLSGIGLGLAAVQKIVEEHRGELRVESRPGKGSVLTVVLPRTEAARSA